MCYNRRNRNTLISVTNFDNKYRRMKRVLEAKTSFAYEYIFLVRGGGRSSKTIGGEPFCNRAETICSVVLCHLRMMTTGLYECPCPLLKCQEDLWRVRGVAGNWPPPQIFAPETRSWADFPLMRISQQFLRMGVKSSLKETKKGTTCPCILVEKYFSICEPNLP